jgi:GYF domain 2
MSATQDDENWFVLRKGKRSGPHTLAALLRAVDKGIVGPEAGIWCVGWAEWRIARDVPELFGRGSDPDLENSDAPEDQDPVETPDHIRDLITKLDEAPPILASQQEHRETDYGGGLRRRVMISGLSVLAVLVIVFGSVWVATSMGIIRVEFMPP